MSIYGGNKTRLTNVMKAQKEAFQRRVFLTVYNWSIIVLFQLLISSQPGDMRPSAGPLINLIFRPNVYGLGQFSQEDNATSNSIR
jgi:hypothetical protein